MGVGLISESLACQNGISTIYERVSEACGYRAKDYISNIIFICWKLILMHLMQRPAPWPNLNFINIRIVTKMPNIHEFLKGVPKIPCVDKSAGVTVPRKVGVKRYLSSCCNLDKRWWWMYSIPNWYFYTSKFEVFISYIHWVTRTLYRDMLHGYGWSLLSHLYE